MESNHEDQSSEKDFEDLEASKTSGLTLSSDGRMLVKLKLPRLREGKIKEDDIINPKEQTTHFCSECNKSFSSGKALGGHMSSAHVQANKGYNNSYTKKLKSYEPTKFKKLRRSSDWKITCSCCGKDFKSKKSLFGHMRTHPEREWRGMAPPGGAIETDPSSSMVSDFEPEEADDDHQEPHKDDDDDDQIYSAVNLTETLKGWSAKAPRGGKGKKLAMASVPNVIIGPEEEALLDVCNQLMSLSSDVAGKSFVNGKQRGIDEAEAISSNSLTTDDELKRQGVQSTEDDENIHSGHSRNDNKGKRKAILDSEISENIELSKQYFYGDSSDTESDSEVRDLLNRKNNERIQVKMMAKNKKRRKMIKLIDSSPGDVNSIEAAATPSKYKCSECDKSFTTYQALGGHRSSHNKFKISIHNTIDEIPSSVVRDTIRAPLATQSEGTKDSEPSGSLKGVENTHQCTICKKNFPSGQALGGHMRGHKTAAAASAEMASSSQVTSSPETIHKVMEFDLNELPNMDD